MKKFNKDNYNNISKEDIIELAELALLKITEQLKRGEIPEYSVAGSGHESFKIDKIEVFKYDTEYSIEVGGASIISLAYNLPNLRDEIAKYGIKKVNDISRTMYYRMKEKYYEEQLVLKMKSTLHDLNVVYDMLTEWQHKKQYS